MNKEDLTEQVAIELEFLEQTIRELIALADDVGDSEPTVRDRTAAAAFLAQFYTGIENVLKRISRFRGVPLPSGDTWHAELIRRFSEPSSEGLPVLFSADLFSDLGAFRKFRHVVHHGYGFQIEWARMVPGIRRAPSVLKAFRSAVERYIGSLYG